MAALISLLTDFGLSDTYVGQVKGAIAAVAPGVTVVDLTHDVPAQDVRTGAFLLMTSVEVFPAGTVHLAVVDPGVGSLRRAIAAKAARGDVFVGPDNSLLVPALAKLGGMVEAVDISADRNWGPLRSTTFHGRDLFAPVAARIATGAALAELGPHLEALDTSWALPEPAVEGDRICGEILHVDTYGNLVTNIPHTLLPARFSVTVGEAQIPDAPQSHYASVRPGELLAVTGSAGYLEISAREASASLLTQSRRGDPVIVQRTA
ncbi:MAG: SAM-dependent chlorinase/fluorinase [Myxococcaceae bacterium]|nr:SAM-dependent chlorinase/fluorinase [Myxococcaceae bacterium]